MAHRNLFLRILYRSIYFVLYIILCGLLLITPGDAIQRSVVNRQWYNIWIIASAYVITVSIVSFVYIVRLYVNRTVLASIPKSWVPIEKGDVKQAVYKIIVAGLGRSSAIAYAARPRVETHEEMIQDEMLDDGEDEARMREKLIEWNEEALDRDTPIPMPPHRPVWGTIEHCGWASPNSPDLPNLQYGTVISEIPNLIEAQALRLAPPDPTSQSNPPLLDPEAAELLQRSTNMSLRNYFGHLASLGVVVMDEAVADFLERYEAARFSTRPVCDGRFRELMHLFAEILRSIQPLDPTILDQMYEDQEDDQEEDRRRRGGLNERAAIESDIDNDAPAETIPSTPRTISRPSTASTQHSFQRQMRRRTMNTYRTAPSTPNSRRNVPMTPRSVASNSFSQMQRYYTSSQHSSAASFRSRSSNGSGSVIRLADHGDPNDLPYVLTLTESTATRY